MVALANNEDLNEMPTFEAFLLYKIETETYTPICWVYAKFCENKILGNGTLLFTYIGKSCPSCEFL